MIMGRELKRVALDFKWPLHKVWEGFLNPHYKGHCQDCKACEGSGSSPQSKFLHDQWYGSLYSQGIFEPRSTGSTPFTPESPAIRAAAERAVERSPEFFGAGSDAMSREAQRLCDLFNSSWSHHLDEQDVAALLKAGRLSDFTRRPRTEEQKAEYERIEAVNNANRANPVKGYKYEFFSNGYIPTPQEVNDWSIGGFGHDAINCWVCVKAKAKRLKYPTSCAVCKGEGSLWDSPENKHRAEHWKQLEPPTGDGYQMWETVSEGSPVSPVFATPEELARYLADSKESSANYEQWLAMIHGPGWAMSAVSTPEHGFQTGVQACGNAILAKEGAA